MIGKIDKVANERKVSFAEVVREAVDAFDGHLSMVDEALIEKLLVAQFGQIGDGHLFFRIGCNL